MISRIGTFVAGVLVGALLVSYLNQKSKDTSISAVHARSTHRPQVTTSDNDQTVASQNEVQAAPSIDPPRRQNTSVATEPARIPRIYREIIGPVYHLGPTLPELHAMFEREPRDETWAYAMEAGINDYIANRWAGDGTVVEYVECRSQHCEIAGYVHDGYENKSASILGAIRKEGWWQGGNSTHSTGGNIDGLNRFVIILNRHGSE